MQFSCRILSLLTWEFISTARKKLIVNLWVLLHFYAVVVLKMMTGQVHCHLEKPVLTHMRLLLNKLIEYTWAETFVYTVVGDGTSLHLPGEGVETGVADNVKLVRRRDLFYLVPLSRAMSRICLSYNLKWLCKIFGASLFFWISSWRTVVYSKFVWISFISNRQLYGAINNWNSCSSQILFIDIIYCFDMTSCLIGLNLLSWQKTELDEVYSFVIVYQCYGWIS